MRTIPYVLQLLGLGVSVLALTAPAYGFDPNAGVEPLTAAAPTYQPTARYLPSTIVPTRYYVPSSVPVASTAPVQPTVISPPPIHAVVPQPAIIAPLPTPTPVAVAAPVYAEPSPAVATPVAGYVQPAAASLAPTSGKKSDRLSLGIEGYYDDYREDSVALTDQGFFGSITGSYEHYFNPNWYGTIEARGARGQVDYESVSGTIDNINQWETEGRLLVGYDQAYPSGNRIKVYTGGGARYFSDELKGKIASGGASGYDRRITQLYVPLGVTYEFQAYGLQFAPNFEYDQLIYGHVQSRLQNITGYQELNNTQTAGYGLRGEFLVGQMDASGRGWQAGPFIRYWNIPNSDVDVTPSFSGIEPENTRLQVGAKLKWLF